jgi:PHD/YefM family antitoxin component YafN of YafNO toxin-antitoxin module
VLVGEEDWRAMQETLYLASVPGLDESIRQARAEGIEVGSTELRW